MTPNDRIQFFASEEPAKPGMFRIVANLGEQHHVLPIGTHLYQSADAALSAFCRAISAVLDQHRGKG